MDEPVEYVEIARHESPRGELVLRERRSPGANPVLELRANGIFVMDTLETGSERAMATAALAVVPEPRRVLVGGLGLGFTTAEVLADPRVEACTVVEIEQALVDWMRDGTIGHGPRLLAADRLQVVVNDVSRAIAEATGAPYDVVLLDVDNGPGYLVHQTNAALYRRPFLAAARAVTAGALVIWSAAAAPELEADLRGVFGNAEAVRHDVLLQGREEEYWLYVARR
ncbi:hypothetical protein [Nocardioides sp. AE5]|uniref:spermine/spermidine synthase domain-containing protein n=1 Tax=Nocardioides sp. AE5 TaxID=2962573 RepID=UPI0028821BBD|nr:hypothetical protein [Nocardioides sp. AE5]MDT0202230.1 hypothetical protein [Nocardioides sp. AE5]